MSSLSFLQPRNAIRLGLLAVVLLAGIGVVGWNAGFTPPPPAPPKSERAWSLPKQKTEDSAKDLSALTARKPWGAAAAGPVIAKPGRPQAKWRLAGVVQRGGENMVLVASGPPNATKFDYFKVGDKLPDGGVLLEIAPDSAVVQDSGSDDKHVYQLFDNKK